MPWVCCSEMFTSLYQSRETLLELLIVHVYFSTCTDLDTYCRTWPWVLLSLSFFPSFDELLGICWLRWADCLVFPVHLSILAPESAAEVAQSCKCALGSYHISYLCDFSLRSGLSAVVSLGSPYKISPGRSSHLSLLWGNLGSKFTPYSSQGTCQLQLLG